VLGPIRAHWPAIADGVPAGAGRAAWLTASWLADTTALLEDVPPGRVLILTYEDLVSDPDAVVAALADHTGLDLPAGAAARVRLPSATANADAAVRRGQPLLSSWRERLSTDEQREVLGELERSAIDIYGPGDGPDDGALQRLAARHRVATVTARD